jgi:hypothetical protein
MNKVKNAPVKYQTFRGFFMENQIYSLGKSKKEILVELYLFLTKIKPESEQVKVIRLILI